MSVCVFWKLLSKSLSLYLNWKKIELFLSTQLKFLSLGTPKNIQSDFCLEGSRWLEHFTVLMFLKRICIFQSTFSYSKLQTLVTICIACPQIPVFQLELTGSSVFSTAPTFPCKESLQMHFLQQFPLVESLCYMLISFFPFFLQRLVLRIYSFNLHIYTYVLRLCSSWYMVCSLRV